MKPTAIIIALLVSSVVYSQNLVVYSDSSSKPTAVRSANGKWKINNAEQALERYFILYNELDKKYQAAIAILKLLSPQGCPTDNKKYIKAVANYNQLISR